MKLSIGKTKFALLFSLGFMGVAILATIGLVFIIESDAEELRLKARELAFQKAQAEERFETIRLLEDTGEEHSRLQDFVLTEQTIIDFISNIEAIAGSVRLEFDTQTISPEKTKDPTFDDLTMSFAFSGSEEAATYMIEVFESLPYESHIKHFSLSVDKDNEWTVVMSVHITILEYEE